MVELLAPAGDFEKLKTALYFGADAAYIGGKNFSLRSFADNFGEDRLSDDENAGAGAMKTYFKIENAVDGNGEPANLAYIDFVKVQTGVNAKAGWLGENSTEVFGFTDENLNQGK